MSVARALPAALAVAALTACAPALSPVDVPSPPEDRRQLSDSGVVEVADAPLALMSIDAQGAVGLLDLATGEQRHAGSVSPPLALAGDGRYGFVSTADGLEIIDSGRWTWLHGDHNHYYRGEPRVLGSLSGSGPATVTSGLLSTAGSTGVYFTDSGEGVLLDNAALADGDIVERFRVQTEAGAGLVAPLGEGALVTVGPELVYYDATGTATTTTAACTAASGAITTPVGVLVGCAEGAVLGTWRSDGPILEHLPYPDGIALEAAVEFEGRKGRPTVATLASPNGLLLLNTRDRTWQHIETDVALDHVSAAADAEGHVVAVDAAGHVRVYLAPTGEQVAATGPLTTDSERFRSLLLDDRHAYLADPTSGLVFEIDYADGARVARTLETPTSPRFVTEVGR